MRHPYSPILHALMIASLWVHTANASSGCDVLHRATSDGDIKRAVFQIIQEARNESVPQACIQTVLAIGEVALQRPQPDWSMIAEILQVGRYDETDTALVLATSVLEMDVSTAAELPNWDATYQATFVLVKKTPAPEVDIRVLQLLQSDHWKEKVSDMRPEHFDVSLAEAPVNIQRSAVLQATADALNAEHVIPTLQAIYDHLASEDALKGNAADRLTRAQQGPAPEPVEPLDVP